MGAALVALCALFGSSAQPGGSATVSGAIPPPILAELQRSGHARVIVEVAVDPGESLPQAQDRVLDELRGTRYQLLQRYVTSAYLALDTGPDALAVLARSPRVLRVSADPEVHPASPGAAQ